MQRHGWTAVFLGIVAACGAGAGDGPTFTQSVGSMGGELSITAAGDPQLAGTRLLIPSGALAAATEITIGRGVDQAISGQSVAGPSVRFLPDGLQFQKPVTLTLPYDRNALLADAAVFVAATSSTGRSEMRNVRIDSELGTVSVDITHFTDYQVLTGTPSPTDGGADAIDGGTPDAGRPDGGAQDLSPGDQSAGAG